MFGRTPSTYGQDQDSSDRETLRAREAARLEAQRQADIAHVIEAGKQGEGEGRPEKDKAPDADAHGDHADATDEHETIGETDRLGESGVRAQGGSGIETSDEAPGGPIVDAADEVVELPRIDYPHEADNADRAKAATSAPPRSGRLVTLQARFDEALESPPWRTTRTLAAVALVLFCTLMPVLDQILSRPQVWAVYVSGVIVGALCLLGLRAAGSAPALAFAAFWVVWALGIPLWHRDSTRVWSMDQGVMGLLACACVSFALVALARGRRFGVALTRGVWIAVAVVFVPFGMVEVITGWHFAPGGSYEPPGFSPSGLFNNPNNFAVVLLVCLGVLLLRLCERMGEWQRVGLTLLAVGAGLLIVATLSRLVVLAAIAVAALAAHLAWRRAHGPSPGWTRGTRLAAGAAVLFAASFVLPGMSRLNPLIGLIAPDPDATARSDELRVALMDAGLRMWSTQPWAGIGAGRFETLLEQDPGSVGRVTALHNTFVELLTEYGLVLAGPLAVTLVWLVILLARRVPTQTHGAPSGVDAEGARYLLGVYLLAFGVGGVLVSSALPWTMWWLVLASAVTTAWWLGGQRLRERSG
ncbi:hypothetical protein BJY21_003134 [Kineosphaera limosa]|uniref:O-antigen ligase-related domain-containing protein n=1 Tax=Kineosphaera limosa NBRC 100340 TaxID=1184609 RepID=K6WVP9_9MICO|nr:O-antigen ligase family protein [Kineosphaera limosa]NYE01950.1 hypothetical protein [Kineosphaera limosa]GAB96177.1 hypothetical protein KILIM_032_00630 [Kineosphaera limosa NBRC 100340]